MPLNENDKYKRFNHKKHMSLDCKEQQLDAHFREQDPFYDKIYGGEQVEIPTDAFHINDGRRVVGCIDEGVAHHIHIASPGSFILDGEDHALDMLRGKGIGIVTSHSGCAAAKAALRLRGIEAPTPEQVDEYAHDFSRRLASSLGAEHEHISLNRPLDFHIGRGVVYDGSRGAKIHGPEGIKVGGNNINPPPLFRINRKHSGDPVKALHAVAIATGIATGNNSFGERINPNSPFVIFALGHPTNIELSAENLQAELEGTSFVIGRTRSTLRQYFGDNIIKIVPISAPRYRSRHQQKYPNEEMPYNLQNISKKTPTC